SVLDVFADRLAHREVGEIARAVAPPPLDPEVAGFRRQCAHGRVHDRRDRQHVGAACARPLLSLVIPAFHPPILPRLPPQRTEYLVPGRDCHWIPPEEEGMEREGGRWSERAAAVSNGAAQWPTALLPSLCQRISALVVCRASLTCTTQPWRASPAMNTFATPT